MNELKWVHFAIAIASFLTQKASTRLNPLVPIIIAWVRIISIFAKQFSINIFFFIYAQYYI